MLTGLADKVAKGIVQLALHIAVIIPIRAKIGIWESDFFIPSTFIRITAFRL